MTDTSSTTALDIQATEPDEYGYRQYTLGGFTFRRDEYFVHITWPTGSHVMSVDDFLRALQRDCAWDFFYGTVNFDGVIGTVNHYGTVDLFAGRYNDAYRKAELDHMENFPSPQIGEHVPGDARRLDERDVRPVRQPGRDGEGVGREERQQHRRRHPPARRRQPDGRRAGRRGDPHRRDPFGQPHVRRRGPGRAGGPRQPGFESEVAGFSLFAYLSRSDVTWNPSVVSVCKDSLYCPTTEEYILPIIHGNDRVEWFIQLSDEIRWDVADRDTGAPRAKVIMRAGDVAAMPADIRHQGYSTKRSMLLVWENASPELPELIASGRAPQYPIEF